MGQRPTPPPPPPMTPALYIYLIPGAPLVCEEHSGFEGTPACVAAWNACVQFASRAWSRFLHPSGSSKLPELQCEESPSLLLLFTARIMISGDCLQILRCKRHACSTASYSMRQEKTFNGLGACRCFLLFGSKRMVCTREITPSVYLFQIAPRSFTLIRAPA